MGPPHDELGVLVPVRLVLVRTEALALIVDQVVAYTTGFAFRLSGRARVDDERVARSFGMLLGQPEGDMDRLLLGVELADGRKATNLDRRPIEGAEPGAVLMGGAGSAGGGRFESAYWVWPLPPDGPLSFVCQWGAEGVELTRVSIDGSAISAAGGSSELLWPDV
jgi:hypothetical protein